MWHEHGLSDLDWQPEMQAERMEVASRMGQAAMYLTSVQAIASEEFVQTGHISPETREKLSEAHATHFHVIDWLTRINKNIHEVEQ